MQKSEYTFPTQAEIDATILNAQQVRAEAFARWIRSAWAWIRHRRSITVTTDRVSAEMSL